MFRFLSRILLPAAILITIAACSGGDGSEDSTAESGAGQMSSMSMPGLPDDLDTATIKESDNGSFNVAVTSNAESIALNQIHSWTIHLQFADGQPVEGAKIDVGGGMPQHNHGFPTSPEVTEELGDGDYLLEGMKFSMPGWWELALSITTDDESDSVTFNIILP